MKSAYELAMERLQKAVPDALSRFELIPFWDPDVVTQRDLEEVGAGSHYVQMSKAKHLYVLQDTKRLVQRLGLRMVWPIDVDPWWEVPHLAWLKARRLGLAAPFYAAITAARWERGENVCDPEVIRGLGPQIGVNGDLLAGATEDREIRNEGLECLAAAYHDDIFGVPYFRVGRHRFWGLDRLDEFLDIVLPTLEGRAATSVNELEPLEGVPVALRSMVGGYDTDTAGGCG